MLESTLPGSATKRVEFASSERACDERSLLSCRCRRTFAALICSPTSNTLTTEPRRSGAPSEVRLAPSKPSRRAALRVGSWSCIDGISVGGWLSEYARCASTPQRGDHPAPHRVCVRRQSVASHDQASASSGCRAMRRRSRPSRDTRDRPCPMRTTRSCGVTQLLPEPAPAASGGASGHCGGASPAFRQRADWTRASTSATSVGSVSTKT